MSRRSPWFDLQVRFRARPIVKKTGSQKERTDSLDELNQLRREAGEWLKTLREARGLSQNEMRRLVAPDRPTTFISLVENGHLCLTSDNFEKWAEVLKIEPQELARNLFRYYNPLVYQAIFE